MRKLSIAAGLAGLTGLTGLVIALALREESPKPGYEVRDGLIYVNGSGF